MYESKIPVRVIKILFKSTGNGLPHVYVNKILVTLEQNSVDFSRNFAHISLTKNFVNPTKRFFRADFDQWK